MSQCITVRLGDVVDLRPGFASGKNLPDGVLQVRMHNVSASAHLDFAVQRRVPVDPARLSSLRVEPGDVLFNATNAPGLVGKTATFRGSDEPVVYSNHFYRLRPRRGVDGVYLGRLLSWHYSRGTFRGMCRQWVNQASINRDQLLDMQIPLPSLGEQQRIAAILDAADDLRAKRHASITALGALSQSIFLDMFGNPNREWSRCAVADAAAPRRGSIRTGPFGSQLLHSEFVDDGVAVLGIDNAVNNEFRWDERRFITEAKYRELSRYRVHPGDVLITIMGTIGRCAVVPDDIPVAINTKHLCCITLDPQVCRPDYLHAYFLHHPEARDYLGRTGKGAIMTGLNLGVIKEMPLVLPPMEIQSEFAARTVSVRRNMDAAQASLDQADALFSSLQSRAFHGDL